MAISGDFLEPWGVLSPVFGHMGRHVLLRLLSLENSHCWKSQLSSNPRLLVITDLQNCSGVQNNWATSRNEYLVKQKTRTAEKSAGSEGEKVCWRLAWFAQIGLHRLTAGIFKGPVKPETRSRTELPREEKERSKRKRVGEEEEQAWRKRARGTRASGLLQRADPQPQNTRLYIPWFWKECHGSAVGWGWGREQVLEEGVPAAQSLQTCLTLSHAIGYTACQAPLSMGFLQVRILERVALLSSTESSQPRDRTHVSCIADRLFTHLGSSGRRRFTWTSISNVHQKPCSHHSSALYTRWTWLKRCQLCFMSSWCIRQATLVEKPKKDPLKLPQEERQIHAFWRKTHSDNGSLEPTGLKASLKMNAFFLLWSPPLLPSSPLSLTFLPISTHLIYSLFITSCLLLLLLYPFWSLQTLDYIWPYVTINSLLFGIMSWCFPLFVLKAKNSNSSPFESYIGFVIY